MPKSSAVKSSSKIIYPPGVKELTDDLSTDDLVRRLKECAQAFQNMSQDDDNSDYIPLALYLGSDYFLEHPSKDVRLFIACSIADVFRVFAPEAPYKDPDHLKVIFEFFIQQLKGLEDPKDATFKRYFYLLENLAWVKSFNICIELEDNQSIFCQLFTLIFNIVNDNHSVKVKNFMMDMMCPLISEADSVSQELLDIILAQIIEPRKTQNKNAYNLAKDIFRRTASTIEPYLQAFFNNALILGKTSRSDVAHNLYDLIYELNSICPSMLIAVFPQLEFKLKSNEEKERLEVTRLLARMFSDKNSNLAGENKLLWNCFLGRFTDISVQVRIRCIQYSMHFLLNHPELRANITEQLRRRQRDPEETVRYEVVMAIISAAKKDFSSVSEELLNFVKERTLDKKFKIRKEALLGLAMLYKQHMNDPNIPESALDCTSWIKNKVLHGYYQSSLEDKLLVERILHTCLVPYQCKFQERMERLYQLFATVDNYAIKAFNEILKCQNIVRKQFNDIIELLQQCKTEEREKALYNRIVTLSKNLSEPIKSQEYIRKFCNHVESSKQLRTHVDVILQGDSLCSDVEDSVKEILKSLGFPVQMNSFYMTIKQLLERAAPVMIDRDGIRKLLSFVHNSLLGDRNIDMSLGLENSSHRGLQLLHTLSYVYPGSFQGEEVFNELISFFNADDEHAAELSLQILTNIGKDLESLHPNIAKKLLPLLQNFVENGSAKQAKYAVACINTIVSKKEQIFGHILEHLKQHLSHSSGYFRTALVSVGHIAHHCPDLFFHQIRSIISKVIVKELLMTDQEPCREGNALWESYEALPEETKVKMEGMKVMVRWLLGLKNAVPSALSTLRLLISVLLHKGDLMENGLVSPMEKSWLRYTAASCILKLCQESQYSEVVTLEQFQTLAFVIRDECYEVREKFALKLHKGLMSLKLSLDFLAIFSLCGMEETNSLKRIFRDYFIANITKRREYLKKHVITTQKLFSILPDYVLPYAIHLLSHEPSFKSYDDVCSLSRVKECLWFLMEPLMTKNENYSFSFFKRLIENIKQTKDKQAPDDNIVNLKLYSVCDLALGLVISKTTNFVLKDFPAEPSLPSKLFTNPDKNYSNIRTYLPQELAFTPPKKSGIELEMFGLRSKGPNKHTLINSAKKDLSLSSDQKENSFLNGEDRHMKERLLEKNETNDSDANLSSAHTLKRAPRRPKKILNSKEVQHNSSKNSSKVVSESSSGSPVSKKPRGRPPAKKTSVTSTSKMVSTTDTEKTKKQKSYKRNAVLSSEDFGFEDFDSDSSLTEIKCSPRKKHHANSVSKEDSVGNALDKNENRSSFTSLKVSSQLKKPVRRLKKVSSTESSDQSSKVLSVVKSVSQDSPQKQSRGQQKRKLSETCTSKLTIIHMSPAKNITQKENSPVILSPPISSKNSSKLLSVSEDVSVSSKSPKTVPAVVNKLSAKKYKTFVNTSETYSEKSSPKTVHKSNTGKPYLRRFSDIKKTINKNISNSNRVGVTSRESSQCLQRKAIKSIKKQSLVDIRTAFKKIPYSISLNSPSKNVPLEKGKTLSPTIISLRPSPQKTSPASSGQSCVKQISFDSSPTDSESGSPKRNKKVQNVLERTPNSNHNYYISPNKRKPSLPVMPQKENSSMKNVKPADHLVKNSSKMLPVSRDQSSKRTEPASPATKSNSHNIFPVRQSERLSAAAKASRKIKMKKSMQDMIMTMKLPKSPRSPLFTPNRQSGNNKNSKKVKVTGNTERSSGSKEVVTGKSPSKKNSSVSLLAKAIRSSTLTSKSNVHRNLKNKR